MSVPAGEVDSSSVDTSRSADRPEIINNQASRKFRPEIQGLRALAVFLVAAYHFWFGKVSGGVDVFLLISAFLMAGSFTRKIERGTFAGFRAVVEYWIHVFKRILPLASVTVAGVLLGTYLVLPEDRWESIISEAISVVFYYENWWSIANLVNYYAADSSVASPLRHFWSLSLQGQIYILWPLLFLLSAALTRVLKIRPRVLIATVFGVVFAASLAYSIYVTAHSQQTAYFNTFARLWEFALGSFTAIILPWLNINRYLRAVMGWVGIVMIVSCGFIFNVEGAFPGYAALWPTLAAAFIITAGDTQTRFGPEKLLTLPPLLKLGNISYALYLVHWPLLVFYLHRNHAEKAGIVSGVGLLGISLVLAWLLTEFVEKPVRSQKRLDSSNVRRLAVVAACLAVALVPAFGWQSKISYDTAQAEEMKELNNPGARVLMDEDPATVTPEAEPLPALAKLREDWASMGPGCTPENLPFSTSTDISKLCMVGNDPENPTKTVVAVGNSHMQVWAPAVTELAKQENWRLYYFVLGACFYPEGENHIEKCSTFSQQSRQFIKDSGAETVVLTGTKAQNDGPDEVTDTMVASIRELNDAGTSVLALRDHPRFSSGFFDCIETEHCQKPSGLDVNENPLAKYESELPLFATVDMNAYVCPQGTCPSQIGNVYTYMDDNHITKTYVETTSDIFVARAREAMSRQGI